MAATILGFELQERARLRASIGTTQMNLKDIRVGRRHRIDVGDITSLAASIKTLGLLHPIVVDGKGRLVAGARRLAALRALGKHDVPVRVVRTLGDAAKALRAERDENTERQAFKPSELVSLARALEPLERAEARQRLRHGGRPGAGRKRSGKLPAHSVGATRDKLAAVVGVSGRTLDKARAVVEAAEGNPRKFGRLVQQMDRTGSVDGAFRELERQRQADRIQAEPPPLPSGPFRVIVADVPWRYESRAGDITHRAANPYPDMSLDDICKLPVRKLAAKDAVLWLWTTNAHMRDSFDVLKAWGFESKTILTWAKTGRFGTGRWLRGQTEHCHLAVRGKPTILLTNQSTLLQARSGRHSEKPDEFYDLVRSLCPGSKVDLFARRRRSGFVAHGNTVTFADPDLDQQSAASMILANA
jgi:N6-adenosine-specific RNA methylase IME4